jgi:glutathione peroxidase
MGGLQVLEEQFAAEGFHMLGFYTNDFGQAGSAEDIAACQQEHGYTFETFAIDKVTNPGAQPVFDWIINQPVVGPAPGPNQPTWNFHKYLIARDGELVAHFPQAQAPPTDLNDNFDTNPMVVAIRAELDKP